MLPCTLLWCHGTRHPGWLSLSHPSLDRQNEYWLWLRPPLEKNGESSITVGPVKMSSVAVDLSCLCEIFFSALLCFGVGCPDDILGCPDDILVNIFIAQHHLVMKLNLWWNKLLSRRTWSLTYQKNQVKLFNRMCYKCYLVRTMNYLEKLFYDNV